MQLIRRGRRGFSLRIFRDGESEDPQTELELSIRRVHERLPKHGVDEFEARLTLLFGPDGHSIHWHQGFYERCWLSCPNPRIREILRSSVHRRRKGAPWPEALPDSVVWGVLSWPSHDFPTSGLPIP